MQLLCKLSSERVNPSHVSISLVSRVNDNDRIVAVFDLTMFTSFFLFLLTVSLALKQCRKMKMNVLERSLEKQKV